MSSPRTRGGANLHGPRMPSARRAAVELTVDCVKMQPKCAAAVAVGAAAAGVRMVMAGVLAAEVVEM